MPRGATNSDDERSILDHHSLQLLSLGDGYSQLAYASPRCRSCCPCSHMIPARPISRSADLRAAHLGNDLLAKQGERFATTRGDAPSQHREQMACTAFATLIDDLFGDLRRCPGDIVVVMQGKSGSSFWRIER